eukprot:248783_1
MNNSCFIICSGIGSCWHLTANPPKNLELFNLSWSKNSGLDSYPIFPTDNYRNLVLNCHGNSKCNRMSIKCPLFAYCHISCIGSYSYAVKFSVCTVVTQH